MINSDFIKYFKSIHIYPKMDENQDDFTPSTDSIIKWLGNFDTCYRKKLNISEEENFTALYNRDLSIHGEGILRYMEKIIKIASFSNTIGYTYSLTLSIKDIISNFDKVEHLITHHIIHSLGITILETEEIETNGEFAQECEKTLLKIADYKLNIGIVAQIETLYKLNILSSPNFNSLIFTIFPINNKTEVNFEPLSVTSNTKNFKILINEDGLIYSCFELFGQKEHALGSIYDFTEETPV